MKLGLIGVGNMGIHFGANLLAASVDLTVFDINEQALAKMGEKGAKIAKSVTDLARQVDVILLCLPTPAIVENIVCGDEGILTSGDQLSIIIDLSTTGPEATERVAAMCTKNGISYIGAPVSGGTTGAEKGTLTIMASGDRDAMEKVQPVLDIIGGKIFYLGDAPQFGQYMKLINNTLSAVAAVASFEGLVLGAKAGLDPAQMLDVINVSSGRNSATLEKIPQCVLERNFPMRFTTDLLHKDVKLCLEQAERLGATMFMGPSAKQFLSFAVSQGDGPKDYGEGIKHFENWAGVEFGSEAN
jgi:3-hydroxyisobutyrate dehydrogenase